MKLKLKYDEMRRPVLTLNTEDRGEISSLTEFRDWFHKHGNQGKYIPAHVQIEFESRQEKPEHYPTVPSITISLPI